MAQLGVHPHLAPRPGRRDGNQRPSDLINQTGLALARDLKPATRLVNVPSSVRHARLGDVPALADLAARTFPLACPPELATDAIDAFVTENLSEVAFTEYLRTPGHSVLTGLDQNGDVRAYALLVDGTEMDPECASVLTGLPTIGVSKFYVDPTLHGTGMAGVLLDASVSTARQAGASSLWLATNIGNTRARAFYVRNGFVERGTRVFTVGGTDNNDVVLEKPL